MIIKRIGEKPTRGQGAYPKPGGPSGRPPPNNRQTVTQTDSYRSGYSGSGNDGRRKERL